MIAILKMLRLNVTHSNVYGMSGFAVGSLDCMAGANGNLNTHLGYNNLRFQIREGLKEFLS